MAPGATLARPRAPAGRGPGPRTPCALFSTRFPRLRRRVFTGRGVPDVGVSEGATPPPRRPTARPRDRAPAQSHVLQYKVDVRASGVVRVVVASGTERKAAAHPLVVEPLGRGRVFQARAALRRRQPPLRRARSPVGRRALMCCRARAGSRGLQPALHPPPAHGPDDGGDHWTGSVHAQDDGRHGCVVGPARMSTSTHTLAYAYAYAPSHTHAPARSHRRQTMRRWNK